MNNKKAQNVIEYILLIVAVLTVFIFFLGPQGPFKGAVQNSMMKGTVTQIQNFSDQIHF